MELTGPFLARTDGFRRGNSIASRAQPECSPRTGEPPSGLRLGRAWPEWARHAPMGAGSSCSGLRQRLERRFQTAQGLLLRQDQRREWAEPQPAKSGAAKEAPATRPVAELPRARPVNPPCLGRKRHAPTGAGSNCSLPRQRQSLECRFRRAQGRQRWQDQCQRGAEARPVKPDAAQEEREAPPPLALVWPRARLLEQPCLGRKRHAPRAAGWSCSSSRQRQGLEHPLPAMAMRARRLAALTAAGRRGSNRTEHRQGLARIFRWQDALDMPRPARRREARLPTPRQGRRPLGRGEKAPAKRYHL